MKNFSIFFIVIIISLVAGAQAPAIKWQKCYGGSGSDHAYSISIANNGSYLIGGDTGSNDGDVFGNHGGADYWVLNIDTSGGIIWKKILGGSNTDWISKFIQTHDGGYIACGETHTNNNGDVYGNHGDDWDYWVVKLDSLQNIQWQHCYGGYCAEIGTDIQETSDNGFIIAGIAVSYDGDVTGNHATNCGQRDYWVVKIDSIGNIQWEKCYGGFQDDYGYSIKQTQDKGFIVAGSTTSIDGGDVTGIHGTDMNDDAWLLKIDSLGNIQWSKCYGGSSVDWAYSISNTNDNGYICAGIVSSTNGDLTGIGNHGIWDFWIVKIDSIGNIQWQKALGGTGKDWASSIILTHDGGYIVVGYTESNDGDVSGNHGGRDGWVVKLDSLGILQWQKCLGGSQEDGFWSVVETPTYDYVVTGWTYSNDGEVTGNHGGYDIWTVKLSNYPNRIEETPLSKKLEIYPNPASDNIYVNSPENAIVEIKNIQGQLILREKVNNEHKICIKGLMNGIYFVKLYSSNEIKIGKLLVE